MHWRGAQLQTLVEEIGAFPQVDYIRIFDKNGNLLAHTQKSEVHQIEPVDLIAVQKIHDHAYQNSQNKEEHEVFDITTEIKLAAPGSPQGTGYGRYAGATGCCFFARRAEHVQNRHVNG